jgi:hypothetical protein
MTPSVHDSHDLFEKLARAGFAARGVTYGLIGALALMAAFGSGGSTEGQTGALETLTGSGWGQFVLFLVGIGLIGYAIWRGTAAVLDLENQGSDKEGLAKRAAHFGSGLFHAGLGIFAFALLFGGSGGSGGGADQWTAQLMSAPFGRVLVGLAGLIGFAAAGAQFKKALKEEYKRHTRIPEKHGFIDPAIKAGLISRGTVFAIIGGFLLYAAFTANPDNARGLGGALSWLQQQAYGGILLAMIAAGLVMFAFYSFLQARYRFIPDPEAEARSKLQ